MRSISPAGQPWRVERVTESVTCGVSRARSSRPKRSNPSRLASSQASASRYAEVAEASRRPSRKPSMRGELMPSRS